MSLAARLGQDSQRAYSAPTDRIAGVKGKDKGKEERGQRAGGITEREEMGGKGE